MDLANGYCCGGTLGALIEGGGIYYILSNYHVFQADTDPGGNGVVASAGDVILQPGLIDINCNETLGQGVATLSSFTFPASLPDFNVDASIAEIIPGMVDATGAILEIGTISGQTVDAYVRQAVKKSGRTSGLTFSKVYALNGNINVTYDLECAGAASFTKSFTGQIIITNRNKGREFLQGGDSGSLLVEDKANNPAAIGLLYAGSSKYAIANPIDDVLNHFSNAQTTFQMVGN